MQTTDIIFFDIPTTIPGSIPTSPNTWKVRLVLNYKKLRYQTRWVESVDIEAVCKPLGIPPTTTKPNGDPKYTLPALIDNTQSTPVVISDSTPIIEYLEKTYPDHDLSRAIVPSDSRALLAAFEYQVATSITALLYPLVVMDLYSKKGTRDQHYLRTRMEALFGIPLEQVQSVGHDRERLLRKLERAFNLFATSLRTSGGSYIMGQNPCLMDFTLCGLLLMFYHASPDGIWKQAATWRKGIWVRYLLTFQPLMHNPDNTFPFKL
ncbi:glutathione S-transferase [Hygrophoropsis aurantiaca]|uniref:Glutathione S-transferase n=1 Tax=Hygrophoropsis aurantiaca TaxID=72124 RepID=A0ACB8AQK3_9AGAM|nr:glutathione S-transferase [Hygrophoropsis aurantiaca]